MRWNLSAYHELTDDRRDELIEKLSREVVERGLTAPAIFLLESFKPFSFIGSQMLIFFEPIVQSIFSFKAYDDVRALFEDRENVERLLCEIEDYDVEFQKKLKDGTYFEEKEKEKSEKKSKGGIFGWLKKM
jgi:hypothetical protein